MRKNVGWLTGIPLACEDAPAARDVQAEPGLGFLLRECYRGFARELDTRLAEFGVTHAQWVLLWFLQAAGTLTPLGLCRAAGIKKASGTRAIEALRSRGIISAARDASDGRKVNLHLTLAGKAMMSKLMSCAVDANARVQAGMNETELLDLTRLLRRVAANVERREGAANATKE